MVGLGTGGKVTIFNGLGTVNVVADVNGYFTDASSGNGGAAFVATLPGRLFDTRNYHHPLGPQTVLDLALDPTTTISALVLNETATNPTAYSYLTVYPDDGSHGASGAVPLSSDLNFGPGQTVPNLTVVGLSAGEAFNTFNGYGNVDVVIDADGYYGFMAPAPPAGLTAAVRIESRSMGPTRAPWSLVSPRRSTLA